MTHLSFDQAQGKFEHLWENNNSEPTPSVNSRGNRVEIWSVGKRKVGKYPRDLRHAKRDDLYVENSHFENESKAASDRRRSHHTITPSQWQ